VWFTPIEFLFRHTFFVSRPSNLNGAHNRI
jgi:hypothetical protein